MSCCSAGWRVVSCCSVCEQGSVGEGGGGGGELSFGGVSVG